MTKKLIILLTILSVIYPNFAFADMGGAGEDADWARSLIDARYAFDNGYQGKGVKIAVIDSGIFQSHPDFKGKAVSEGYNYIENDYNIEDTIGHGTAIASIIAAKGTQGGAAAGIAGEAEIISLKCFSSESRILSGTVITRRLAAAIRDAVDIYHCDIINLSFDVTEPDDTFSDAIRYAYEKGAIMVAPTGNSGTSALCYPAGYPQVIGVGAVGKNGVVSRFSNHNKSIDVAAPGEELPVLGARGLVPYKKEAGTSFAAAYVSAYAAVLKAMDQNLSPDDFRNILKETSIDSGEDGWDEYYGFGVVNIRKGIEFLEKKKQENRQKELSSLRVGSGALEPSFKSGVYQYKVFVPEAAGLINITPAAPAGKEIRIRGQKAVSGEPFAVALEEKETEVVIELFSSGVLETAYSIFVIRADTDSNLGSLALVFDTAGDQEVKIDIASQQKLFEAFVLAGMNRVWVLAEPKSKYADVYVNNRRDIRGKGVKVNLSSGENEILIRVIAEDNSETVYTLKITRPGTKLKSLAFSNAALLTEFSKYETLFAAVADHKAQTTKILAEAEDVNAEVSASAGDIALEYGINRIPVTVKVGNKGERTYQTVIVRKTEGQDESEINAMLIEGVLASLSDFPADKELIGAKSVIEDIFIKSLDEKTGLLLNGQSKERIQSLYTKLTDALGYTVSKSGSGSGAKAFGLINNLKRNDQSDEHQKVTVKLDYELSYDYVGAPVLADMTGAVMYRVCLSEIVREMPENKEIVRNDFIQPKDEKPIILKLMVPGIYRDKSTLALAAQKENGEFKIIPSRLVKEKNDLYFEFETQNVGNYLIVYDKEEISRPTETVVHKPYMTGHGDGTFGPADSIKRSEAAAIFSRLTEFDGSAAYQSVFSDVGEDTWYHDYVGFIGKSGLMKGYEDGLFRPERNLTRAEFAALIFQYLNLSKDVEEDTVIFQDIKGHWAADEIMRLYRLGMLGGYEDHSFRPDQAVLRAEAAVVTNRAVGRVPNKERIDQYFENHPLPFTDVLPSHWAFYDIMESAIAHNTDDFHG